MAGLDPGSAVAILAHYSHCLLEQAWSLGLLNGGHCLLEQAWSLGRLEPVSMGAGLQSVFVGALWSQAAGACLETGSTGARLTSRFACVGLVLEFLAK